ncbi:MAG: hypothetical protein ABI068_01605 [Ktedonobacterales bacterium]
MANVKSGKSGNMTQTDTAKAAGSVTRRRALWALGAAGVVGAGALAAPVAIPAIERQMQAEEWRLIQQQIGNLEGVTLDAAIEAAELTLDGVHAIVLPVAQLLATIDGDALSVLISALDTAHNIAAAVHAPTGELDGIRNVFVAWRDNAHTLPIRINDYSTADITSAETYLKALKQHTQTT